MERNNIKIFISHRSLDKKFADILFDFLVAIGVSRNTIFFSSLPGNDVKEKINDEIKLAISESEINIVILSQSYYESAYCLNEAGVIWYKDNPVIPIALPEINSTNMYGFLDNNYKIRRLNNSDDIAYIYDTVADIVSLNKVASVFSAESTKLIGNYSKALSDRTVDELSKTTDKTIKIEELTTDDERIVLYYILSTGVRKIIKTTLEEWLQNSEVYNVNIDNAFDLLSQIGMGMYENDCLTLDIHFFKTITANAEVYLTALSPIIRHHIELSSKTFEQLWSTDCFDDIDKLFVGYIISNNKLTLGDRWLGEREIKCIEEWENNEFIKSELSTNYYKCLNLFKKHNLVHPCEWTSEGNARKYRLIFFV